MDLYLIIYLSIFFWFLPPIRQYGTKFFYYFLVLALTDPISLLLNSFGINANFIMVLGSVIICLLLRTKLLSYKNNWLLNSTISTLSFATYFLPVSIVELIFIVIHLIILLIFLKYTMAYIHQEGRINFFHFVLIFYEFSGITKIIAMIGDINSGTEFLIITAFSQFFVALFFTVFSEDSKKIQLLFRSI